MKKYYLVNYETIETAYFDTNDEAFAEAQNRNRCNKNANWKAYTEQGEAIFSLVTTH